MAKKYGGRARGYGLFAKRGVTARTMAKSYREAKPGAPRVLTSQAATAVGRPGFKKGFLGGVQDGKLPVRRVMRNDRAVGITQPGANVITSSHIDLVGAQAPKLAAMALTAPPNANKKAVPPLRVSRPVYTNVPGKVSRSIGPRMPVKR